MRPWDAWTSEESQDDINCKQKDDFCCKRIKIAMFIAISIIIYCYIYFIYFYYLYLSNHKGPEVLTI